MDGASLEYRALAARVRADRCDAPRRARSTSAASYGWTSSTRLLSARTKLVAIIHVSNSLGTINPVEEIIEAAHRVGALVLVDGAQAAPHLIVDVQALDADFYTLLRPQDVRPDGHRRAVRQDVLLDRMPPYQGGGDMIASVTFEKTTYNTLPHKFEAGTPNIAGVVGFGAAVEYLNASTGRPRWLMKTICWRMRPSGWRNSLPCT